MATRVQAPRRARTADLLRQRRGIEDDYFSFGWLLLIATFITTLLVFFLFTPYTHQLDEIKNTLLWCVTPFLLLAAVAKADFSRMSWKSHASTMLFGLFILSMVISYIVNPHKEVSERVVWFQVAAGTFTIIYAWYMDTENKLRKTMMLYVLIAFGAVVIGLFFFAGQGFTGKLYDIAREKKWGPEWQTLLYTLARSKSEMYSTILNSDFFAAYLLMTIPITLAMFFVEEHLLFKVLAVVTFLLMNVCLFFTNSNDSFMSIVLITYPVFFLLGILYVKQWNVSKRVLIAFFVGSAVLALTIFVLMIPQLAQTWGFKAAAFEGRKILWSGGFWPWLYRDDPTKSHINIISFLFGTGPGGYRFYFPVFRRADFFDNQINNVTTFSHNYYIDVLEEFGLIGFVLFMCFYGRVLYDAFQQVRHTGVRTHRFYQMAIISGLSGIALQNVFSPNNRWAVCAMIFYSLFGIGMGIHHIDNPGDPRPARDTSRDVWFRWALVAFSVIFIVRSVPQGYLYMSAAMDNASGLKYMDVADNANQSEQGVLLDRARQMFESAIQKNPTFVTTYYKLAHVYNQLGDSDKAVKAYETLDYLNPNYSEIHLNLGIMYSTEAEGMSGKQKLAKLEEAYDQMKEAARQELKPNVQWIAGVIGEQLVQELEKQGAEETSKRGLQRDKTEANTSKEERTKKAISAVYEDMKTYYRNIADYNPQLAEAVADRKKYYEKSLQKLLALDYLTQDDKGAEQVLTRLNKEFPKNEQYLRELLAFLETHFSTQRKIDYLVAATHADPVNVSLRKVLADAYFDAGQKQNYLDELHKIEILEPKSAPALASLFLAYREQGDKTKEAEYRQKLARVGLDADKMTTGELSQFRMTSSTQVLRAAMITSATRALSSTVSTPTVKAALKTTATDVQSSR